MPASHNSGFYVYLYSEPGNQPERQRNMSNYSNFQTGEILSMLAARARNEQTKKIDAKAKRKVAASMLF
jgi:hypothetical protein